MEQFIDLDSQYKKIRNEIDEGIAKVLKHGKYIMGPEVEELELRLAEYAGVRHCISCSSGTDALLMPLMAWNIGEGDAVFTTPFTFVATAEVISLLGATPVFVDIDRDTYNIDPLKLDESVERVLEEGRLKPAAVIPVDLFGLPADYESIGKIAGKYGLKILEDAAQGFGGSINGKKAGSFGDAAGTSFFPAKPLGCYGDGGAVFTNDDGLADILKSVRIHGKGSDKYDNIRVGLNARLDTIQAAILIPKLKAFTEYELEARNTYANLYTKGLGDAVKTPFIPEGTVSSWAQYSVLAKNSRERSLLMDKLKSSGIPTMIYYVKPLHLQGAFASLGYKKGDFPISEDVSTRIFSLPMHPYLEQDVIDRVVSTVTNIS